jgi:hypothetical protein
MDLRGKAEDNAQPVELCCCGSVCDEGAVLEVDLLWLVE